MFIDIACMQASILTMGINVHCRCLGRKYREAFKCREGGRYCVAFETYEACQRIDIPPYNEEYFIQEWASTEFASRSRHFEF